MTEPLETEWGGGGSHFELNNPDDTCSPKLHMSFSKEQSELWFIRPFLSNMAWPGFVAVLRWLLHSY